MPSKQITTGQRIKNLKQLMSISYCNVPGSGKMAANLLIHIPYDTSIRDLQNNVS